MRRSECVHSSCGFGLGGHGAGPLSWFPDTHVVSSTSAPHRSKTPKTPVFVRFSSTFENPFAGRVVAHNLQIFQLTSLNDTIFKIITPSPAWRVCTITVSPDAEQAFTALSRVWLFRDPAHGLPGLRSYLRRRACRPFTARCSLRRGQSAPQTRIPASPSGQGCCLPRSPSPQD